VSGKPLVQGGLVSAAGAHKPRTWARCRAALSIG